MVYHAELQVFRNWPKINFKYFNSELPKENFIAFSRSWNRILIHGVYLHALLATMIVPKSVPNSWILIWKSMCTIQKVLWLIPVILETNSIKNYEKFNKILMNFVISKIYFCRKNSIVFKTNPVLFKSNPIILQIF